MFRVRDGELMQELKQCFLWGIILLLNHQYLCANPIISEPGTLPIYLLYGLKRGEKSCEVRVFAFIAWKVEINKHVIMWKSCSGETDAGYNGLIYSWLALLSVYMLIPWQPHPVFFSGEKRVLCGPLCGRLLIDVLLCTFCTCGDCYQCHFGQTL